MGGGKGGSEPLPNYSQLLSDQAYYNRIGQLGPGESMLYNAAGTTGARILSPAEQRRQELSLGLSNTALGTMLGWYGGQPAQYGQFDPLTGTYGGGGAGAGAGGGGAGGVPPGGEDDPRFRNGRYGALDPDEMMDYYTGGGGGGGGARTSEGWYDPYGDTSPGGLPGSGVGGPYSGLDFGDMEFLQGLIDDAGGGGGGAGGGSWGSGGGGGYNLDFGDLTQMLTYDEQGNPTIGDALMSELDLGSLPGLPGIDDFSAERDRVEQAMFDRRMALGNPMFDQRAAAENEMLANRGMVEGGAGWGQFRGNREQDYGNYLQSAMNEAIIGGGAEQSRLFGSAMQGRQQTLTERLQQAGLHNQVQEMMGASNLSARQQEAMEKLGAGQLAAQGAASSGQLNFQRSQAAIQNALAAQSSLWSQQMGERTTQWQELANLMGLGSPAGMQGYWSPGQIDVTGASSSAANNQMINYQTSPFAALMQLGGTLGGAALSASSEDYKDGFESTDGEAIIDGIMSLDIRRWNYKGEVGPKHIGPMAEEFERAFGTPSVAEDGTVGIDVASALGVALKAIQTLTAKVEELEDKLEEANA